MEFHQGVVSIESPRCGSDTRGFQWIPILPGENIVHFYKQIQGAVSSESPRYSAGIWGLLWVPPILTKYLGFI